MSGIFDNHVTNILKLTRESDPEKNVFPLDPIEAVKKVFDESVKDIEMQKKILRELPIYSEFEGKTEELKKLYPWNFPFFVSNSESIKSYLKNYDVSKGYTCSVFVTSDYDDGKLVFDRGTMNFIGARTSRGKTTAMVSMAVDALANGLPVLFSTFEETDAQIYTRIVLNLAYRAILENKNNNTEFFDDNTNFRSRLGFTPFSPGKFFQSLIRDDWKPKYNPFDANTDKEEYKEPDRQLLIDLLKESCDKADEFFNKKQLMIFNGYLAIDFQEYIDALKNIERGTVVFADYIQKIPSPENRAENRYAGIKQMLRDIDKVVKKNELININGAQFGRTDNKTNPTIKDSFTDEAFQESSDIEQIGEIEIGIGRDPADPNDENSKDRMFFSVLKNRHGGNNPAKEFDLIDGRKFSYYATK